jgi:hypothetical protein
MIGAISAALAGSIVSAVSPSCLLEPAERVVVVGHELARAREEQHTWPARLFGMYERPGGAGVIAHGLPERS